MRKVSPLALLLVVLVGSGAALDYEFQSFDDEDDQRNIFEGGEEIEFRLNVSTDDDYNLTVKDPDGNFELEDEPMNEYNFSSYFVYNETVTVPDNSGGDWESYVNFTVNEDESSILDTNDFHVADDTPRFFGLEFPGTVLNTEETVFEANVTHAQDNIEDVTLEVADVSENMAVNDSGTDLYSTYRSEVQIDDPGTYDVTITATDTDGDEAVFTDTITVEDKFSDDATVDVSVEYACDVDLNEFRVPGDGVIGPGVLEFFRWTGTNVGSIDSNISAELNVTYQGDSQWSPGDEIGDGTDDFYHENFSVGPAPVPNITYEDDDGDLVYNNETLVEDYVIELEQEKGWYLARTNFTYECHEVYNDENTGELVKNTSATQNFTIFAYDNFQIVNVTEGLSDAEDVEEAETVPSDVSFGDEETDETAEGDADDPGQTPGPTPELSMNIFTEEQNYETRRGQFVEVNMTVTNEGNVDLENLTIEPQVDQFDGSWNISTVSIGELGVNNSTDRQILVQPQEDVDPGNYFVPLLGSNEDRDLDIDYFNLEVLDDPVFESRLRITEIPREIEVEQNSTVPLPLLLQNRGDTNLTNLSAEVQNLDQCGEYSSGQVDQIGVNDTESLPLTLETGDSSVSCDLTIIVSSEEGAYSFANVEMDVVPPDALIPREFQVPFLAMAWTGLLAAFAVFRRKYGMESTVYKAPFVLLVMGQALIFLYLVVDYYQLVSAGFLPF